MGSYKEIKGDLIELALSNNFDVIAHGCNCFCTMGAGIAPQMAEAFEAHRYPLEGDKYRGDVNKLGTIDYMTHTLAYGTSEWDVQDFDITVVNAYTQYHYGRNHKDGHKKPIDYEALVLCLRKINRIFENRRLGLPQIGCGLAGGDWSIVKQIIQQELKDCHVTIVIYNK